MTICLELFTSDKERLIFIALLVGDSLRLYLIYPANSELYVGVTLVRC